MDMHFQLGSAAAISLTGLPDRHAGTVREAMAPWEPTSPPSVATQIEISAEPPRPVTERLGDAGDGRRTARAGDWLVVEHRNGWFAMRWADGRLHYQAARSMPPRALVRDVVMTAILADAGPRGGTALHGSYARLGEAVPLVVGWAEAGKTETAIALAARGAVLTGDKWVVLDRDGSVAALPGPVNVRAWLPGVVPEVAGAVSRAQRTRRRLAGVAQRLLERVAGAPVGTLALGAERMAALAELGTRVQVPVRLLNGVWGRSTLTGAHRPTHVVLLRTTDGPLECRRIDVSALVDAIVETSTFELRALAELASRARYLGLDWGGIDMPDRRTVADLLGGLPALEVRTPFPGDPRPIADEILRFTAA